MILNNKIKFLKRSLSVLFFVCIFFIFPTRALAVWDNLGDLCTDSICDHNGDAWTISTNTEVAGTHINVGAFTVNSGVTVSVKAYDGSKYGKFYVTSTSTDIQGTIAANGVGYLDSDSNAYKGGAGSRTAGGGGHGGYGGAGQTTRGLPYGSLSHPDEFGGNGGSITTDDGYGHVVYNAGGRGGGVISITSPGTVNISGNITSAGAAGVDVCCGWNSGGGAGGSIYINAGSLSGNGNVTANGGNGGYSGGYGGGGGGGRIAMLFATNNTFSGLMQTNSGNYSESNICSGTAFIENSTTHDVTIPASTPNGIWKKNDRSYNLGNLAINSQVTFQNEGAGVFQINSTSLSFGDYSYNVYINGSYTNNTDGRGVYFNTGGNIIVPANVTIYGTGAGYSGGTYADGAGPGRSLATGTSYRASGGAGYGSAGYPHWGTSTTPGGETYGNPLTPTDLGSGAGSGYSSGNHYGGSGGSAVQIATSGNLQVLGSIQMDGTAGGWGVDGNAGGGGSGGSVYLSGNNVSIEGVVSVNGGNGANNSLNAAGGSGRIAIYHSGTYSATAGVIQYYQGHTTTNNSGGLVVSGLPSVPASMAQYRSNGTTSIATGASPTVPETTVVLKMNMADGESATLTPEIEMKPLGTDFNNFPTATGSGVVYTYSEGGTVEGSVTQTGLTDATSYHWQARVCDASRVCSGWSSFGGNAETDADLRIYLNQNPNNPTDLGPTSLTNSSYDHDSTPTFTFAISDPDAGNTLSYRIQISTLANYSSLVVDYSITLGAAGTKTFTVGQPETGGFYVAGFMGQTLTNGNYYWRVMTTDNSNATSAWVDANASLPAFKIDLFNPSSNAHTFTGFTSGSWQKTAPTISWTAGADANSGILGYCLSLNEYAIGGTATLTDPAADSGLFTGLDDGVTRSDCPYIVSANSVNLGTISGLSLTTNKKYYFSIKAINQAGNIFTDANTALYSNVIYFKYDNVAPTNVNAFSGAGGSFSNINDMYFNWPTTQAADTDSGLLGFQYAINNQSNWLGTTLDPDTNAYYTLIGATQPYYLNVTRDGSYVIVGDNTIYFRVIDLAGNYSTPATYRTSSIAYGGEAPYFFGDSAVTVTPADNTTNSYALAWSTATASAGRTVSRYYYMINTTPPQNLSTMQGNSAVYIPSTSNSVAASSLPGVIRGTNTVYVVVIDDLSNYSPSNYLRANFVLNSNNPDPPLNVSVSDASLKAVSLWRASLAWSEPLYKGTGTLSYAIQRSDDGVTWTTIANTSGTAYVDVVAESKQYYWRVASYDTSDISIANPSWSNAVTLTPKGSYTSAPDLSSGPTVSNITTKKAKISWSTSRSSDSKVAFGTEPGKYNTEEPSNSTQTTDHVINLTNLSPGTKYYYIVKWTDEDGNTGTSAEKDFTTSPAPSISSVTESNTGLNSTLISFTVKDASKATVLYGKTTEYGGSITTDTATSETTYTLQLLNLDDGTEYHYKLRLQDSEGSTYDFEDHVFSTLPRPKISDVQIQQVANTSQSTLYITWQSNTEISSIVSYYPQGQPSLMRNEVNIALSKNHQVILRGLLPDTSYIMQARGVDKIGNEARSELITFTTATDTRPPEIVDLRVEGGEVSQTSSGNEEAVSQLIVSWNTDEPATTQVEFGEGSGSEYSQKTQEDSNLTVNHMIIISNLGPSKVYHLKAISKDRAGNIGNSVDTVSITPKITDSAFTLVITNLQEAFGFLGGLR